MHESQTLMDRRERLLGPNVSTFYDDPVHIVRAKGVWLWDAGGRRYLDCYNNVPHVGHCHPKVVDAIARQAATLNTHTRYLHEGILDYIEALTRKFDASITSAIMVCSGSEANDVALRMAAAVTGNRGLITTSSAYHGNTAAVSQLSLSKLQPGGVEDHVRHIPAPDSLRNTAQPERFEQDVRAAIASLQASGQGVAALILCPFLANEGFPDLPHGFLDKTVAAVRAAGGVVIADEVQPGFGRLGTHWWGHQKIGIQPEIVTIGKPMANGHPVAAVLAGLETLSAFRNRFGYFNTFGGNPVSCAAAHAVLEIMDEENLIENARIVGEYARQRLNELRQKHPFIADVRGSGLFFGVELVRDANMTPATELTRQAVEAMRANGVLLHSVGPGDATLKLRPPMPFSKENADLLVETLDHVLTHLPGRP